MKENETMKDKESTMKDKKNKIKDKENIMKDKEYTMKENEYKMKDNEYKMKDKEYTMKDKELQSFLEKAELEQYYDRLIKNKWTMELVLNISNEQELKDLCQEWEMSAQENMRFRAAWNAAKAQQHNNVDIEEKQQEGEGIPVGEEGREGHTLS